MPIDLKQALGAQFPVARSSWGADDVILYHLGIGAGFEKPLDPKELEYTYEKNLKVLPSYGVIPLAGTLSGLEAIPGLDINFSMVLHGEQDLVVHRPIPVSGEVEHKKRIAAIWDKGKAGVIVMETVSSDAQGPAVHQPFQHSVWRESGRLLIAAKTKDRDTPVVTNSAIDLRS